MIDVYFNDFHFLSTPYPNKKEQIQTKVRISENTWFMSDGRMNLPTNIVSPNLSHFSKNGTILDKIFGNFF